MTYLTELSTFPIPLSHKARQHAQFLRGLQANPDKANQVYLNTLAVWAVHAYLEALGLETDLDASDSQDLAIASLSETADLMLSNIGKLECRPVLPDAETLHIPEDVWQGRIGYLAVQFDSDVRQATLLGFLPAVSTEIIPLQQLQSLDQFLAFLETATQASKQPAAIASSASLQTHSTQTILTPTHLGQLLQGVFTEGWLAIQDLFSNEFSNPAIALRQPLKSSPYVSTHDFTAGKLLNLSVQLETHPLLLLVGIFPKADHKVQVSVRLRSANDNVLLPANISLAVIGTSDKELRIVQKPSEQDFIQLLRFTLSSGTPFAIRVSYGESSITEQFIA